MSEDKTTTETAAVEAAPVKKTTTRRKAVKPEVVAEAPPVETKEVDTSIAEAEDKTPVAVETEDAKPESKEEYEFFEELPNKQQAAPVVEKAEASKETRVTKAIDGDETEPELVEHDKAFDKETAEGTPVPEDYKPEPIDPPAEVDQPEIHGQTEEIQTNPSGIIEEGETEPTKIEKEEDVFAEGKTQEPNPGRQGGEGDRYDPEAYDAASSEAEKVKHGKTKKTDNPKLKRLKKYGA